MPDFISAVFNHNFMLYALLGSLLASLSCGIVGTYVVARRLTYLAGAIVHCVLAGLGGARYLQIQWEWQWLQPIYGALAVALLAALIIGWVSLKAKQREDSIIGALWAVGMAGGVLFLAATPGYATDLMNYLFGNILLLGGPDLTLMAILALFISGISIKFYPQLLAVCYDEEFARLRGLNTNFYYLLLLVITSLTVVLLSALIGLLLVIALLTLPAALAALFVNRLSGIMLFSTLACAFFGITGLFISYISDLPTGAITVLVAGGFYLAGLLISKIRT